MTSERRTRPSARREATAIRPAILAGTAAALLLGGGALRLFPGLAPWSERVWTTGLLLGGAPVVLRTLRDVARGRFRGDVVATLSILTALALGQSLAGLVIVLMQTGGETLDAIAEGRASTAVRELEAAAPRVAHRIEHGRIEDISVEDVAPGDLLLVRPGELVPCDGTVVEGRSAVDVSRLTGEPLPLAAEPGTALSSGSGNGNGALRFRATAPARDSHYARIVDLVRTAETERAPIQRLADRFAAWFTPATLGICALAWLTTHDPLRVLAVLVVATPCPLILATPVAIIGGINRAARRQIVVRSGAALEQLAAIDAAVVDKTGTLTLGRPELRRVVPASGWNEADVLRVAGAVEHESGHLLARNLVAAAERALVTASLPPVERVVESPGRGVTGWVEGRRVSVGSLAYVVDVAPSCAGGARKLEEAAGGEPGVRAHVVVDGAAAGLVEFADRVRDDATRVIAELRALGLDPIVLLSGDSAANVDAVAAQVGVDEARADLSPADKVDAVRALIDTGRRVLMVGDGTNDAPAMAAATVGLALAAHGGGITAEAAGIVVLADDLGRIPEAVRIGRRTMKVARQGLIVGLGLSGAAMLVAAFVGIPPVAGALLQEAIDVAVILNALRTSRRA